MDTFSYQIAPCGWESVLRRESFWAVSVPVLPWQVLRWLVPSEPMGRSKSTQPLPSEWISAKVSCWDNERTMAFFLQGWHDAISLVIRGFAFCSCPWILYGFIYWIILRSLYVLAGGSRSSTVLSLLVSTQAEWNEASNLMNNIWRSESSLVDQSSCTSTKLKIWKMHLYAFTTFIFTYFKSSQLLWMNHISWHQTKDREDIDILEASDGVFLS